MEDKLKELEDLSKLKESLHQDKQRIANELHHKEELLRIEAQEKNSLEKLIKDMEQKLVVGGMVIQDKEKEQAKAFREYQNKIKQERKQKKKLLEEKQRQEEELMDFTR